ncbi:MAG: alpha/beta hydrolase [Pirellulales bacterium]
MRPTATVVVVYFILIVGMMMLENSLIFLPSRHPEGFWSPDGLAVENATFHSADGTRLHGWYVHHENPQAVILFSHGNAGNLSHRAAIIERLNRQLRASVLIFDYRGYGKSEGSPTEQGIVADARAARHWLAERAGVEEREIVLLGRSLGAGVAVDLAARDGARALVLQNAFPSLPDVAAEHYWWLPVRLLMRNRLDSLSIIDQYHGPLLQSHGTADRVVPYALGRKLFEAANEPKQFIDLPGLGHNDIHPDSYYRALDDYLSGLPDRADEPGDAG